MEKKNMINKILTENTDELIVLTITIATFTSYFVGVDVPNEPMMMVIGAYIGKRMTR